MIIPLSANLCPYGSIDSPIFIKLPFFKHFPQRDSDPDRKTQANVVSRPNAAIAITNMSNGRLLSETLNANKLITPINTNIDVTIEQNMAQNPYQYFIMN